jgi:hypothetical protein
LQGFCSYVEQAGDRGFTEVLTQTFPAAKEFEAAPEASPRLVAYLLQAFASEAEAPLPPPPSPRRMYRPLLRLRRK